MVSSSNLPNRPTTNVNPPAFHLENDPNRVLNPSADTTKEIEGGDLIPLIDLQSPNSLEEPFDEACKTWGIFRLVNHGIPETLLSRLQGHAREIFGLPLECRKTQFTKPISYFCRTAATSASGVAISRALQRPDWLEGFHVPVCQLSEFQSQDPLLRSFRLLLEEYAGHLSRLARILFGSMGKNLKLDPGASHSYLSEATGFIRVYRYPPCPEEDETLGLHTHTDSSVISILNQDEVGGLEILKDDVWLQVKPIPNTLIVHIGDMMQAMSDDKYKSVIHRVKVNKNLERISIGYFVFPEDDCVIQSSKYKPFTYGDFRGQVEKDIKTEGSKVGLKRFSIIEGIGSHKI